MALSYEFSIGSVRAKEKHLFSGADIEQMLALKSEDELVRYLKDKAYGDGDSVDEMIESNVRRMWHYIRGVAPDMAVFEPFMIQNDAHNLKTMIKGVMTGKDHDELLMEPCTIPTDTMQNAVDNNRFDSFPLWLQRPARRAYQILAETKDARLSDAYIDKALMEHMLELGDRLHSAFLREYLQNLVFYANVKTALRGARTGVRRVFLEKALCDCPGFDKNAVIPLALQGEDALCKYLKKTDAFGCAEAMKKYESAAPEFEKWVDDRLMQIARRLCRMASEGPEPLLGYYMGCVYEHKLITILSSGLKTATPPEKIRERLRECYG